jgi:hypothetical protein
MKKSIFIALLIVLFTACKSDKGTLLPGVKGAANNIVIVMSGNFWESAPGETIRANISEFVSGLSSEEPKFDYLFVPHANFDHVYKRQRNILITKIGPDYEEKLIIQHDTWAKTQVVLTITAPNSEAFVKLYKQKASKINDVISTAELKRLQNAYKSNPEKIIVNKLQKDHNIKLTVPKGYKLYADTGNFIYLLNEYRDIIEGLIIYYYPYTEKNTFTNEYLIEKRNALVERNVPGEIDGSYMTTESKYEPDTFEYNLNGNRYTKEIRGLWKMQGGMAMGGPFVSITQYDEARKRIVTVEGFVFAPAHEKRNLVHRIEAILYSLDFVEDTVE